MNTNRKSQRFMIRDESGYPSESNSFARFISAARRQRFDMRVLSRTDP